MSSKIMQTGGDPEDPVRECVISDATLVLCHTVDFDGSDIVLHADTARGDLPVVFLPAFRQTASSCLSERRERVRLRAIPSVAVVLD